MEHYCKKCSCFVIAAIMFVTAGFSQNSNRIDSSRINSAVPESGITLSAQVNNNKVPLNRTINLLIQLKWYGNLDRYQVHQFDNPILNNLEIIANSSSNKVSTENGGNIAVQEYSFTLQPKSLGMSYIEGVIIKYTDLDTDTGYSLTTNRIEVKVIDPIPEPGDKSWILWLLLFLVLAGAAFVVITRARQRKAERIRRAQEEAEKAVPLEEKYLKKLKELVDLQNPNLDIVNSFSQLSRFLRHFLKEKFNVPAEVNTTEDVVYELNKQQIEERFIEEVKDVLTTSDIFKFSGGHAEKNELVRIYGLIESGLHKSLRGEIINKENDNNID
ncbi:hypothetical protein JXQ31_09865 [candidate division KSB1 bacterium]|nr:hypothetical protein [candidate division KSB1 bacterium]